MSKYNQVEDLEEERKGCPFDVEELTNFLDGGKERTERRRFVQSLVQKDKVFDRNNFWLNFEQQYERACEKMVKASQLVKENNLESMEDVLLLYEEIEELLPDSVHRFGKRYFSLNFISSLS